MRQEQVLLHYARKNGITRLGLTAVPTLAASKERAGQAIEMELMLKSLRDSRYGREPWTQAETTRERLTAEPMFCFKKGPRNVDVEFDNDPENTVQYTSWDKIYYQDDEDQWQKVSGYVDLDGLYYEQKDKVKRYYVAFADEAKRYGQNDQWSLLYNNDFSVTSRRSGQREDSLDSSFASSTATRATPDSSPERRPEQRPQGRRSRAGTSIQSRQFSSPSRTRSRSRSRSRTRSGSKSPGQRGRTTPRLAARSRSRSPSSGRDSRRSPRSHRGGDLRGAGQAPVSPEQVGSSRRTVEKRLTGRLRRLLEEARDPPALVIGGPANGVKCYRHTLKRKHGEKFLSVSTTFFWTSPLGPQRESEGRMIVLFANSNEREWFLKNVKVPATLIVYKASFNGF